MPRVDLELSTPIARTARVKQLEGIFDVPEAKTGGVEYHFDVPWEEQDWQIGLIHGPSGGGKSSVARALFGQDLVEGYTWPQGKAVVDCFGDKPIREITKALSSVGFSSPPSWIKPYVVLSNGERFRANLARALLDDRPAVAFDEFTSVVDRTVAQIGSHAVAKTVRQQKGKRFVAVSCHDDIIEWLQPDWTLEPHIGRFQWRSVQRRPDVAIEYVRVDRAAWSWFAPHHYLSRKLHKGATCVAALIEGQPAAFIGVLHFPHPNNRRIKRISRTVVLPDFQGIGLSMHMMDFVGGVLKALNFYCHGVTAHPALAHAFARSPKWTVLRAHTLGKAFSKTGNHGMNNTVAWDRRTTSVRYVGPAEDPEFACAFWAKAVGAPRPDGKARRARTKKPATAQKVATGSLS